VVLTPGAGGQLSLRIESRRLLHGARVAAPGLDPSDDSFSVEPGVARMLRLTPAQGAGPGRFSATVTALNLLDRVRTGPVEMHESSEDGSEAG
jgi:hypothetical protein